VSEPTSTETEPTGSAVQELARDDVERTQFLRMAGKTMGAGAAAIGLAAFIAACGGSSKSSSSSSSSGAPASTGTASQPTTTAPTEPTGKFPLHSATSVTKLAATVENLGASAYLGQAGNIKSKEILAAALAIHTIEARHAAPLNMVLKLSPTPDGAFAKPMSMSQVLSVVKPFIA
jgi:hypothetical protein